MCTIPFGLFDVPDVYMMKSFSSLSIGSGGHSVGWSAIAYIIELILVLLLILHTAQKHAWSDEKCMLMINLILFNVG